MRALLLLVLAKCDFVDIGADGVVNSTFDMEFDVREAQDKINLIKQRSEKTAQRIKRQKERLASTSFIQRAYQTVHSTLFSSTREAHERNQLMIFHASNWINHHFGEWLGLPKVDVDYHVAVLKNSSQGHRYHYLPHSHPYTASFVQQRSPRSLLQTRSKQFGAMMASTASTGMSGVVNVASGSGSVLILDSPSTMENDIPYMCLCSSSGTCINPPDTQSTDCKCPSSPSASPDGISTR